MIKSGHSLCAWLAFPIALSLATSGCATKKYVRQQVTPVHQQVATLQKQTNDKVAYLNNKEERDISQVNERISTTDQRVNQLADATQQAQGTASRAMDAADANSTKITKLGEGVANALHYELMEKADVMFRFNQATLTPDAKRALDEIANKAKATPRAVVELAGFTDPRGSKNYNFALSRRRAEAVQRYLVQQSIPPRSIQIVGMGKDTPPPDLAPENSVPANASRAERYQAERRVQVRLFGAGELTDSTASQQ